MRPHVGFATRLVDVPVGTPMAGFAARTAGSRGVHDPTSVRAIVLDGIAVVSIDVCTVHEDTIQEMREQVAGVVDDMVVTATHTHSGPAIGRGRAGGHDHGVHHDVVTATRAAVVAAASANTPARMQTTQCFGTGVAHNRRHPDVSIDPPLTALRFLDRDEGQIGILLSYPCHPVVLDGTNLLISGDYVGYLRQAVEARWPGTTAVFLPGAAGDVNTGHSAEASYRPQGAATRTFAEAERIGNKLAAGLTDAVWCDLPGDRAVFRSAEVHLPFAALDPDEVASDARCWEAMADRAGNQERGLWQAWARWARQWRPGPHAAWSGRVSALTIGRQHLVFLPGEPFWQSAQNIAHGREPNTLVIGYSDGVPGYLPTRTEIALGGYEVSDAHRYYGQPGPFLPGCAEILEDATRRLLE